MKFADWCVSGRELATISLTIDGNPVDVTFPGGGAYLIRPGDASRDLLERFVVAMGDALVPSPDAFVTEARYVRLTAGAVFTVTWGAATALRDLLGFTGDLAGASSYTAPNHSPLLWSPGKRFTPELAPLNAHGALVLDISATIGEGGNLTVRTEGDGTTVQRFAAEHVARERYWSSPPTYADGEFTGFWLTELTTAKHFVVLREVGEGDSVTDQADYDSASVLGPYVADWTDESLRRTPFARAPGFELVEAYYTLTVPVVVTPEFSA